MLLGDSRVSFSWVFVFRYKRCLRELAADSNWYKIKQLSAQRKQSFIFQALTRGIRSISAVLFISFGTLID